MPAQRKSGFTLVELLVVISIISILSVIGLTIYTGVQKGARDAKRREDIIAIAKAMEVNYGKFNLSSYSKLCQVTITPTYDCSQWFGGGAAPADPLSSGSYIYGWCESTDATGNPPSCPIVNPIGNNSPDGRDNWMVCASLEAGGKYCRQNQR